MAKKKRKRGRKGKEVKRSKRLTIGREWMDSGLSLIFSIMDYYGLLIIITILDINVGLVQDLRTLVYN